MFKWLHSSKHKSTINKSKPHNKAKMRQTRKSQKINRKRGLRFK